MKMNHNNSKLDLQLLKNEIEDAFEHRVFYKKGWETWKDVSGHLLELQHQTLCFSNAKLFLFFLPVYLMCGLEDAAIEQRQDVVFNLILEKDHEKDFLEKISLLNENQKKAVTAFLLYIREHPEYWLVKEAEEALQNYWGKYE
jgi:hypothetical protein